MRVKNVASQVWSRGRGHETIPGPAIVEFLTQPSWTDCESFSTDPWWGGNETQEWAAMVDTGVTRKMTDSPKFVLSLSVHIDIIQYILSLESVHFVTDGPAPSRDFMNPHKQQSIARRSKLTGVLCWWLVDCPPHIYVHRKNTNDGRTRDSQFVPS